MERYILTLAERSIEDSKELGKGHKIMEDYIKDAVNASDDEMLLEAYDKEWALKDLGMREGYQEGFDKGIKEGLQEGLQHGIEQGKVEDVRNMLKENLDINLISNITGLSVEKINLIENSN